MNIPPEQHWNRTSRKYPRGKPRKRWIYEVEENLRYIIFIGEWRDIFYYKDR